jgi:Fe-Mn family superoxide dismutase
MTTYQLKSFEHLKGIEGLSDQLLENHFALYQGYVANTNKVLDLLDKLLQEDKQAEPMYAEMERRLGWEWNGMRLHEYYFENMKQGGSELAADTSLWKKVEDEFGSFAQWEKDFRAVGAMRGVGWVILYYDKIGKRLVNTWINEHDGGHLAGSQPLLVMDVFEHAYMLDYGIKRAEYINTFMKNIDWETVAVRYGEAASGE